VFWWGGDARAQLTHQVLELYTEKHPNVTFKETWQANAGLHRQAQHQPGGQLRGRHLPARRQHARRRGGPQPDPGPHQLHRRQADRHQQAVGSLVDYGKVDGKQAAVPLAENTPGMVYNKTLVQKLGVDEPQIGWSWEKLITWATDVSAKTNYATYGTMDPSADYKAFWVWLRQQGKDFYNGSKLGFTEQDLTKWFDLWKTPGRPRRPAGRHHPRGQRR
jgi:multiple sugar transport system substrate-binding protein